MPVCEVSHVRTAAKNLPRVRVTRALVAGGGPVCVVMTLRKVNPAILVAAVAR